jgi:L-2,4-diaminobutyrate transaminase
MNESIDALLTLDRAHFMHPSTHAYDHESGAIPGKIVRGGSGVRIELHDGKQYIDSFAGLYCVNIGYGRLGTKMGAQFYGISPDLITVAKGLTSAYAPLSGVIVGEKVWDVIARGSREHGPMGHGWTYSGHPVCAAAAIANLDVLERENLVQNAADVGAYLNAKLHATFDDHPMVGEVRGAGMLAALEFMADKGERKPFDPSLKVGPQVSAAALQRGLIVRAMPHGDILGFAPPLVMTRAEVDEIVGIVKHAVDLVAERTLA